MFKPEGLKQPDCECFKKRSQSMNKVFDSVAATVGLDVLAAGNVIGICEAAREYYIAGIVASLMQMLLVHDDKKPDLVDYTKDMEAIYDRLKPLVMQRLDYVDGALQT